MLALKLAAAPIARRAAASSAVGAAVAATLFFFGAQCVVGLFIGVQSIPVLLTGITLGWSATALLVRALLGARVRAVRASSSLPARAHRPRRGVDARALLAGVLNSTALLGYAMGAREGVPASVLGPASALYATVPVAYGLLVRRERAPPKRAAGLLLALAAPVLLALPAAGGGAAAAHGGGPAANASWVANATAGGAAGAVASVGAPGGDGGGQALEWWHFGFVLMVWLGWGLQVVLLSRCTGAVGGGGGGANAPPAETAAADRESGGRDGSCDGDAAAPATTAAEVRRLAVTECYCALLRDQFVGSLAVCAVVLLAAIAQHALRGGGGAAHAAAARIARELAGKLAAGTTLAYGAMSAAGGVCLFEALRRAERTSVASAATGMYGVAPAAVGWTMLGEAAGATGLSGVVLSLLAIALMASADDGDDAPRERRAVAPEVLGIAPAVELHRQERRRPSPRSFLPAYGRIGAAAHTSIP